MPQVRLRGEDFPLEGAFDRRTKGLERFRLEPDRVTTVSDEAYAFLKQKFSVEGERYVPDHDANEKAPHKRGEAPAMRRESKGGYIIEFLSDK